MIGAARQWACDILNRVETERSYVNLRLQEALGRAQLSPLDKALCTSLVYGTLQRQRALDAVLQEHCRQPLDKLDKTVLVILRMTAYQVLYFDKVPAYAALNDGVDLCKQTKPKAAGLVNAVVRAVLRDGRPVAERLRVLGQSKSWAEQVGLMLSYPDWLVQRLSDAYGRDRTEAMLTSCNEPAPLSVRANVMRTSREQVMSRLQQDFDVTGLPSPVSPYGVRIPRGLDVSDWDAWLDGEVTVQDEGAMLIAPLLQPTAGARMLDMCAAPGGKTTHIAELQGDTGEVVACDVHQHKLTLIQDTAMRLQLRSIVVDAIDGRTLPQRHGWLNHFDAVLVDAPCSGFGVLRHRPDVRWQRSQRDVQELVKLQVELLSAAIDVVRPGGVVVYSTCTLLPEENEGVVERVLAERSQELVCDDLQRDLPDEVAERVVRDTCLRDGLLTPEQFGTDGFYMARLRKKENAHASPV